MMVAVLQGPTRRSRSNCPTGAELLTVTPEKLPPLTVRSTLETGVPAYEPPMLKTPGWTIARQ